jgi:hypothetical protein
VDGKGRQNGKIEITLKKLSTEDITIEFIITLDVTAVERTSEATTAAPSYGIGDSVPFSTSMNNVTLSNWKVFDVDGDYTTLIYGAYMPNTAVSNSLVPLVKTGNYGIDANLDWDDIEPYQAGTREEGYRYPFHNVLNNKSNWDELLTNATYNGNSLNLTRGENVWALPSPTIPAFVSSWNKSFPNNNIYYDLQQNNNENSDGLDGYVIGFNLNPSEEHLNLIQYKNNELYFPANLDQIDSPSVFYTSGYWLISPSLEEGIYAISNYYNESTQTEAYYIYSSDYHCDEGASLRPIIKLPTSSLQ